MISGLLMTWQQYPAGYADFLEEYFSQQLLKTIIHSEIFLPAALCLHTNKL